MYAAHSTRSDYEVTFDVSERTVEREHRQVVEHVVDIHDSARTAYLCLSHAEAASLCRALLTVLQASEHIDF